MLVDSVFFKSVLIQPTRILGVQLRPFSAYHALVLMQFDSPFMTNGYRSAGDLISALCILSEGIGDGLNRFLRFERSRVYKWYWLCKMLFASKKDIDAAIDRLDLHLQAYWDQPDIWCKEGIKKSSVPWPFRVVSTILQNFNIPEVEAWDMGLSKMSCYRACYAEDCGVDVLDEFGVEGQHKRWIKAPNYADFNTLEVYLEWEKQQNG